MKSKKEKMIRGKGIIKMFEESKEGLTKEELGYIEYLKGVALSLGDTFDWPGVRRN